MSNRLKVVLFSEINSKLGSPFLRVLSAHPLIKLIAVVTSPENVLCSYFVNDDTTVDIEIEAKALGIKVLRPVRVSAPGVADELAKLEPDYLIVANFQQLLSPELLAVPRIAAINFHPSPLPHYAGLAPFFLDGAEWGESKCNQCYQDGRRARYWADHYAAADFID
ncbi:hypothetical protein C6H68_15990 [Photorhabdus luminescens]|nr:hypothetical protein C6H68_15990 [Photorhabdus luminescens]